MTILSTHRIHSYKASSVRHRDISPKKVNHQKITFSKKHYDVTSKNIASLLVILKANTTPVTPSPVIAARPEPSAPLAIMATRTIYVWDCPHTVELPENFDIYEGLSRWYPSLYEAVMEEEKYERCLLQMEEGLTDADIENAWAHQDYLEWLCD
jgi:hypothetical protein